MAKISIIQALISIALFILVNIPYFSLTDVNAAIVISFILALSAYFYESHFHSKKETEITRLRNAGIKDHLTQVYNRRYLDKLLNVFYKNAIEDRNGFSVIMLDIDHFKKINDDYGHDKGDEVLKTFAGILARTIRTEDYATRFGGEEFIVLLPDSNLTDAVMVAFRIKTAVAKVKIEGVGYITASMGVIEFNKEFDKNIEEILKNVDELLYKAKENGRDRIVARGKEKTVEITDSLARVLNEI